MKVQDIGHAVVKRAWIVIGLVLIAALVAAVIAQVQSPVYKVETALSVTAPINPATGLPDALTQGAYVALMPSIANYAESISVAEDVSARLALEGIDIPPEELLEKVSAVPEANSTSMKLTFTDGSPTRVVDIANTWGDVLVLKSREPTEALPNEFYDMEFKNLILNGNMSFTNPAVQPEKPTQPKPLAYVGLGIFAGLILGLLLVIFIEYFNPRFRSPQEAEEALGLPVMGVLPKEKGGRSASLLPAFGEGSRTWNAYSELRSALIMSSEGSLLSIMTAPAIPFEAGPAVTANLAISIANTGRKILVIDCDLQGRALSRLLELEDKPGLSDALERQEDFYDKIVAGETANLSILPAGKKSEVSTDLLSLPSFFEELREQEERFDKVVLFGPPLLGSLDSAVVGAQIDAVVVVIDADRCTRKAAAEAMHGLELLGIVPVGSVLANVKMGGRERPRPQREKKARPAAAPAEKKPEPPQEETAAGAAIAVAAPLKDKKSRKKTQEKTAAAPASEKKRREKPPPAPAPTTLEPVKPAVSEEIPAKPAGPPAEAKKAAAMKEAAAPVAAATAAAAAAPAREKKRRRKKERREKPPPAPAPTTLEPVKPAVTEEVRGDHGAPRPGLREPARPAPSKSSAAAETRDELQQVKESVSEDFRRMGEAGTPIPKNWLRALNSDKPEVRESAESAITAYYHSFLHRYNIGEDSVFRITESIIMMMRREGEFASMSEEQAQRRLQQMLVDAGASLSTTTETAAATPAGKAVEPTGEAAASKSVERELRKQEKKRFRLEVKGGRKAAKEKERAYKELSGEEESIDWE
jgi:succinoglycan biosynthesis transport protein ExoP